MRTEGPDTVLQRGGIYAVNSGQPRTPRNMDRQEYKRQVDGWRGAFRDAGIPDWEPRSVATVAGGICFILFAAMAASVALTRT